MKSTLRRLLTNKNAVLVVRLLIAISWLATAHILGYVERLGIGVGAFIGLEIAIDLFADFASSAITATIVSSLIVGVILLSNEIFNHQENHFEKSTNLTDIWQNLSSKKYALVLTIAIFLVIFTVSYLNTTQFFSALGYGISTFSLIASLVLVLVSILLWIYWDSTWHIVVSSLIPFLLSLSYYAGELKAGTIPEFRLMQVVFLDDKRLDGYPLHRVSSGIIFRKREHFGFDVGTVFIPYSSIKMVTEPARDSDGSLVLSQDYPSIIVTAP